jgi:hypothetical protein
MMLFDGATYQAQTSLDLFPDANEYMAWAEMEVRDSYTMAGDPGFEPGLTDSESAVLPLD